MSEKTATRWGRTLPRIVPDESSPDWGAVGAYLKRYRSDIGWSRSEAAQEAGISVSTWNKLENGKARSVRPETLTKIARALKQDRGELSGLAGQPLPDRGGSSGAAEIRLATVEKVLTQVVRRLLEAGVLSEEEFRSVLS